MTPLTCPRHPAGTGAEVFLGPRGNARTHARPLFIADWSNALFLHFEIEPHILQSSLPFEIDLWRGRAFVSLVAFTMRRMRLAKGGVLGEWLCHPIATHEFLNLRAYVRCGEERGICFLSEWLPNRLSLLCGPILYSLPYRHAAICYERNELDLEGDVSAREGKFTYKGTLSDTRFAPCAPDSRDEFLLERYAAFNAGHLLSAKRSSALRVFRVKHEPWLQTRVEIGSLDDSLLRRAAPWWPQAQFAGANFSPGVNRVQMSAPRRMEHLYP